MTDRDPLERLIGIVGMRNGFAKNDVGLGEFRAGFASTHEK